MPPLRDAEMIEKFKDAFRFHGSGGVFWKRVPLEWVTGNLDNCTPNAINSLIYKHISSGGKIKEVRENRAEYCQYEYHYDFCISICARKIYVETTLSKDKTGEPVVTVVNIHDAY